MGDKDKFRHRPAHVTWHKIEAMAGWETARQVTNNDLSTMSRGFHEFCNGDRPHDPKGYKQILMCSRCASVCKYILASVEDLVPHCGSGVPKAGMPFTRLGCLHMFFFCGRRHCLSTGHRTWGLPADQRGIERPPVVKYSTGTPGLCSCG